MSGNTVRPIFYSDAMAAVLMRDAGGVRYSNVYENWTGDQFYGASSAKRVKSDPLLTLRRPIYRIVVRLKKRAL